MEAPKFLTIYEAWRTALDWDKVAPELKAIFEARLDICAACPNFTERKIMKVISRLVDGKKHNEKQAQFDGYKCQICGCKLVWKVSSPKSSCPIKKWTEIVQDKEGIIIDAGLNQTNPNM